MENTISDASTAPDDELAAQGLTPRQLEILSLLTAGKANKEIANQLGIGLGTVKQHVVALFRKLSVTNRAMAVSRGLEIARASATDVLRTAGGKAGAASDNIELRPVTLLSLGCHVENGAKAGTTAWQDLQSAATNAIQSVDSVLIGRPGRGVDIIFGLHCVNDRDAVQAEMMARDVFTRLAAGYNLGPSVRPRIRAALVSDYLLASIGRLGGWTGETVAGRLIAHARAILDHTPADCLSTDTGTQRLLAFARRAVEPRHPPLPSRPVISPLLTDNAATPENLHILLKPPPIGRATERAALAAQINALRNGQGGVVWIEGEIGMGKTTLARIVANETAASVSWLQCCCGPIGPSPLAVLARQLTTPPVAADIIPALARLLRHQCLALIIDDVHAADEAEIRILLELCAISSTMPLLLLGIGRRLEPAALAAAPGTRLHLGRMTTGEVRTLIERDSEGHLSAPALADAVELAAGVPLFAYELAWEARFGSKCDAVGKQNLLPLPLVCLVVSRLDCLALDRLVLKIVAWRQPVTALAVAQISGEGNQATATELKRAVEAGVMTQEHGNHGAISRGDHFRISHPLIAAVLRQVMPASTDKN
ncbi:MAG: LuxR C-terminal-related transcriptional regulator [Rhodospirillaceae bacterium]